MKEVNNLYHFTNHIDVVKSIINDGFKTSYAVEKFGNRNILVPMISFSNILLRDVGENEVIDYGKYGVGISREFAISEGLNPVCYVYENSAMEKSILNLHDLTIIPMSIHIWKDMMDQMKDFTKVTDYVKLKPIIPEVENLINSVQPSTSLELVIVLKNYFEKVYNNAYTQLILAKPYKVLNKKGHEKIAYNEREWRKGFCNLGYIFEKDTKGEDNIEYTKWLKTEKPHYTNSEYTLSVEPENLRYILLETEIEIAEIKQLIIDRYGTERINNLIEKEMLQIGTIEKLKSTEI